MTRTEYFVAMGRNCRLLPMGLMAAEQMVLTFPHANEPEDYDNFFHGYYYGDNPELTNLPRWEDVIGTDAENEWNVTDAILQQRYPISCDTN